VNERMKVIYFGSDVFLPCFDYFLTHHQVTALYTYHHDEDYMNENVLLRRAGAAGIPVHYESITEEQVRRFFLSEGGGLLYSAEYDRLIPTPDDLPGYRGVNLHSSLLPEGRSYYPIECAMERTLPRTGLTIHKMTSSLDGGAILKQEAVDITPEMDSVDVYLALAAAGRKMTEEIMEDLDAAWENAAPQTEHRPYWKRPAPEKITLRHSMTREEVRRIFRCYNSLTQVVLSGRLYYIEALDTGCGPLPEPELRLREYRCLYALQDGHARLILHPKTRGDRR